MKNKATSFFKRIISVLSSLAKAKSMAIKNKTDAMRARFIVLSFLKSKKLSIGGAISHKAHAILGQLEKKGHKEEDVSDQSMAIVNYNAMANESHHSNSIETHLIEMTEDSSYYRGDGYYDDDDDKYPDLTHSLFDEDDELDLGDPNASVIELVRNSKEEGENFNLEDEIDHVADLFIKKFYKKMKLQKLESFKRYQEMLKRSV